jgi:hypothetical protein
MRSFEISYEVYGQIKTVPLVENGSDILVTNDNRKGMSTSSYKYIVKNFTNSSLIPGLNRIRGFVYQTLRW